MQIVGHSGIGTTMNIYSHIIKAAEQDAMEKLDQLLASGE
jgi:hypothetical protein